jgi:SAM-dependent methyltransferase
MGHYVEVLRRRREFTTRAAEYAYRRWQLTAAMVPPGGNVLEVGCGSRAATLILLHTSGTKAVGIDYVVPAVRWRGVLGQLRVNGAERAAKTAAWKLAFDHTFFRRLRELYGAPLRMDVDVRYMDARALTFPDASFDFVFSNSVFEHIDGVDKAAAEIARVLKPGGSAWLEIHLFPSLSGGHVLAWDDASDPPSSPPPWDHLRGRTQPARVFLNGLRADDYLEIFHRHLQVADRSYVIEGEDLVTDEIVAETGYSRQDLTRRRLELTLHRN